jgi:hypothetical protein
MHLVLSTGLQTQLNTMSINQSSDAQSFMRPAADSDKAWTLILSYIPVTQRLRTCSLVSHALHRAATAAVNNTLAVRLQHKHCKSFTNWLSRHASHVTILKLEGCCMDRPQLLQLPCHNLQQLVISSCSLWSQDQGTPGAQLHAGLMSDLRSVQCLQASSSGISAGVLQTLTNLTQLCLRSVTTLPALGCRSWKLEVAAASSYNHPGNSSSAAALLQVWNLTGDCVPAVQSISLCYICGCVWPAWMSPLLRVCQIRLPVLVEHQGRTIAEGISLNDCAGSEH